MIYLASPYTHEDITVRTHRYILAKVAVKYLTAKVYKVFSPIVYSHHIADAMSYEGWMDFDLEMLNLCQSLYVLAIDGWKESRGIKLEIQYAHLKGFSIYMVDLGSTHEETTVTPFDATEFLQ